MKISLPKEALHGGCGELIHVIGTSGGKMPCGCLLRAFGETKPYYCPSCLEKNHRPKEKNHE